jgi:multicomponent Na+:H+ antiporter subunit E
MTGRIVFIVALLVTYAAITGNWQFSNLVVGLALAVSVAWLVQSPAGRVGWRRSPRSLLAIAEYLLVLVWDLIGSGIQVARIVLDPRLPINPGIVAIPSECESSLGTALSAHAITLTPGELVIEMEDGGMLYTHCLDVTDADELIASAQRMRRNILNRIFV